ncbi:Gfo/Idh/MocA family protein [Bacteroides gallinaceum]|uniref:Gfo/Idh/MocA family oxidoreductase n=2 Tax=Bacteroidaceae TaxID=815 RepID=A0ABT7VI23_9BACE|nr:Gfo/Idh/MocA family oxidoreductase [Bacteroides gallinaceum]MBU3857294.1 gfo/Idh/MocA family oxidoreductase [Candidatus Phocaeicola excrementipullorum]MBW9200367.1 gfo/Idh/MocA family oxidoreductase [Bacteroidales bacterium SW299]MDM8325938.1 Gfo/Idh/MocA family oxidoreductase [Bacteroides gallinaceum]
MAAIRTSIIGLGYRGKRLLTLLSSIDDFNIVSVSDPCIDEETRRKYPSFSNGKDDYKNMILQCAPELVIIASPWEHHVEQALFAVLNGCHVALEIKGGLYIDEYKSLLSAALEKKRTVYPLENTIFMREHMSMLNLINAGLLGKIVAVKGGYRHDLRKILISEKGEIGKGSNAEGVWRSKFYQKENGDIYPTHGLAPICLFSGIGRTDRIVELASFASSSHGIAEYISCHGGSEHPAITMGDIIITQMLTEKGTLVTLTHDTTLPRPRSLDIEVQGSKGIWRGEFRKIYIENVSPYETWEDDGRYIDEFEHVSWKKWGKEAIKIDEHHRGMDYIMLKMLAEDMKGTGVYPVNLNDLASWTSVTPLSKSSIKEKRIIKLG